MPSHPHTHTPGRRTGQRPARPFATTETVTQGEVAAWLASRAGTLAERWAVEIRRRESERREDVDRVVRRFARLLTWCLAPLLASPRDELEHLWVSASHLFGAVGAKRGLGAGEVVEEFHILRELIIRDLYRDPPLGGGKPLSLREILRLNRIVDQGVTHASVGHTDTMFFQHFEAPDAPALVSLDDVIEEADAQLTHLVEELERIVGPSEPARPASSGEG